MIYQHPLAYLLGLEGVALLRAWAGDFDRDFVHRRLAEVRRLLDDGTLAGYEGVLVARADTVAAYRQWAASYDGPNGIFDADEPIVHAIVEALPPGDALDAACGTGRFADHINPHATAARRAGRRRVEGVAVVAAGPGARGHRAAFAVPAVIVWHFDLDTAP